MKVLCLCNWGNNRSGAMAKKIKQLNGKCLQRDPEYLKNVIKIEAIPAGLHSHTISTLKMLVDWSDLVINLSDDNGPRKEWIKQTAYGKYMRVDVGEDIWFSNNHPRLLDKVKKYIPEIKRRLEWKE